MIVYDLKAAASELGVGEDELLEILEMFADELAQILTQIESAVNNSNCAELKAAFHAIKGTAANLRVNSLAETASTSEAAAKQQDIASIRQLLPKLQSEILEFNEFLATLSFTR